MVVRSLLPALAGLLFVAPAPASATIFTLTPRSTGDGDYIFNFRDQAVAAGTFTDQFKFTIPVPGPGQTLMNDAVAAAINTALPSGTGNIDFVSASLSGPSVLEPLTVFNSGTLSTVTALDPISVLAGTEYILTITYTAAGANASFSGDIATTAAVPEMATWGMMLLGVGAIGATLRRRQRINQHVAFG